MSKVIQNREPLTEEEILAYLNNEVEKNARQWGEDYIYTEWAKKAREEKMNKWRAGEVIQVYTENYVDSYGNGCGDFSDTLFSDGHVETACYGYLD